MTATTAPPISTRTGMTTTNSTTMTTAPAIKSSCPEPCPRLYFDERTDRKLSNADGRPRRSVVAEAVDVHLVHQRVVAHVSQEHRCLDDVTQPRTAGFELRGEVGDRLAQLTLEPAGD